MSIRAAHAGMPFGTRAELQRWRTLCGEMLAPAAALWLHMPPGRLIGGLCLATGLFCGVVTDRQFAETENGWGKNLFMLSVF